jgi:hypothetical protein
MIEEQRCWRARDILGLQRLPLAERVERYRALGPLAFQEATAERDVLLFSVVCPRICSTDVDV